MPAYLSALNSMISNMNTMASQEKAFAVSVQSEICEPLLTFVREAETQQKTILAEEKTLTAELKVAYENLRKSRNKCMKQLDDIKVFSPSLLPVVLV
jgi:hypothetical protein